MGEIMIKEMIDEMKAKLDEIEADVDKTDKGQKAAGTRVRKAMQEVGAMAKDIRKEVLAKR